MASPVLWANQGLGGQASDKNQIAMILGLSWTHASVCLGPIYAGPPEVLAGSTVWQPGENCGGSPTACSPV